MAKAEGDTKARRTADDGRNRGGRPTAYTEDIADEICRRLAEGETLRSICRDAHMPARSTVHRWVTENVNGFSDQYARARDLGLDTMADELIEIADNEEGSWKRDRLRLDARKWYLSKLAPKRYGDRIAHEHSGPEGDPIRVGLPPEELDAILAFLADTAGDGDTAAGGGEGTAGA